MTIFENAHDVSVYLESLVLSNQMLIDLSGIENPTDTDKTDTRNRILAGSGLKAAFLGTLSTEPTVNLEELKVRGVKDLEAEALIVERNRIRTEALSLI
jgi:hypothetical protein